MHFNQLDLNLFVVFEAIYRQRNLTRVARELHVTQPAVSNALARLRDRLGDPLFERSPAGMVPTPAADAMIDQVRDALHLLAASVDGPRLFDPARSDKTFHFAMNDLAESLVLGPLLRQVSQQAPGVSVSSFTLPRREVPAELASGRLDFAIDAPVLPQADLFSAMLMREQYICAFRPDHPALAQAWNLDAYLALNHLHVSSRRMGLGYVDQALAQLGVARTIQLRVQHYLVAPDIVRETDLVWTLPVRLADRFGLASLPLPFDLPELELHLYWHKRSEPLAAHQWLRQLLIPQNH
ncbi:LysR family transcriptional regulator [Simiduia agarivorans]|uniref:LysR family transcriptional regulator n=1 Tax=Simiduia agarivorans (strain DSM 21679 / JCM 13881 / BCRC 17597 / SA1) TaxID=1117647 RepID=K4KH33_SIMAS|nr:LysR family transcriptional regulator [Simiduia agarivorans]AFU98311.1 LysR family transcriptional regulator [Simiduia agarivorans SA1 = DSM 21679]